MNLLLLQDPSVPAKRHGMSAASVDSQKVIFKISAPYAEHIYSILKKQPNDDLRVGIVNRGILNATIHSCERDSCILSIPITWESEIVTPSFTPTHLILALPRPKALLRIIENAVSIGISRIDLIESWRVEKSYFSSPKLAQTVLDEAITRGLEQGRLVHAPELNVTRGFRHYLEDVYPATSDGLNIANTERFLMHPGSVARWQADELHNSLPVSLAIGPEGGFIEKECESFARSGFRKIGLFDAIVKTEVAVTAALSQLSLIREA